MSLMFINAYMDMACGNSLRYKVQTQGTRVNQFMEPFHQKGKQTRVMVGNFIPLMIIKIHIRHQ